MSAVFSRPPAANWPHFPLSVLLLDKLVNLNLVAGVLGPLVLAARLGRLETQGRSEFVRCEVAFTKLQRFNLQRGEQPLQQLVGSRYCWWLKTIPPSG